MAWKIIQPDKIVACAGGDTPKYISNYIRSIKKLEGSFPNDIIINIIIEFDNVLIDLIRVQSDTSSIRSFQVFRNTYTKPLFDYDKLEKFLLNEVKIFGSSPKLVDLYF